MDFEENSMQSDMYGRSTMSSNGFEVFKKSDVNLSQQERRTYWLLRHGVIRPKHTNRICKV